MTEINNVTAASIVAEKTALFFDLFHTLTSMSAQKTPGVETWRILGVDQIAWNDAVMEASHDRITGKIREPESIMRSLARSVDPNVSDEAIRKATRERAERFAVSLRTIPQSTADALRALKEQGKKIALVSNADPTEIVGWPESPIAPLFDATIFSCDVGVAKPDPDIYWEAMNALGIGPADGVFIGDGGSNELIGARSVGLKTILMSGIIQNLWPEKIAPRRRYADAEIESVDELLPS